MQKEHELHELHLLLYISLSYGFHYKALQDINHIYFYFVLAQQFITLNTNNGIKTCLTNDYRISFDLKHFAFFYFTAQQLFMAGRREHCPEQE